MRPWQTLARVVTPAGPLELRQRAACDFLITIAGRVLMTSVAHRSEDALARLACAITHGRPRPRVLLGGLGMAYTLRAALDLLPDAADVLVADLNACVVDWCRGPIAHLTGGAIADPRVKVTIGDVADLIRRAPPKRYDAIILDLYEGPNRATTPAHDPLYGSAALHRSCAALAPGGVLAVWSEDSDDAFAARLLDAGLRMERHREGRGGRSHFIYLGVKALTDDRKRI